MTHADPVAEFNKRVAAKMSDVKLTRSQAVRAVVIADPELQRQYLIAMNKDRPQAVKTLR